MSRAGTWAGRHRTTLLLVVAAVVAVLGTTWLARGQQTYSAALDPGNPDGGGAQAVARVLAHQGVEVDVVRSAAALDRAAADASTTVVVTSADQLGRSTTQRLLHDQGRADLVVVAPPPQLIGELGLTSYPLRTSPAGAVASGCAAYAGLHLRVGQADAYRTHGCFRGTDGVLLARPRPGLTLLGAPALLTNDQILDADNAAVALRLLGGRQRLVWYVPSLDDLAGADSVSVTSLLPGWLQPGLALLLVTAIALVAWRARRLGPLAREPLPVSVRAVETTRNLGRLYRRSGDRRHAAAALRAASRASLAARLHLPRHADPALVVSAVADHTGRTVDDVSTLLRPDAPPPAHDRDLTDLAQRLAELDREVSQR
jgi:hypothetical protein